MSNPPTHPGEPKWQSLQEWNKMREPSFIELPKNESETRADLLSRFGLTDESEQSGDGWGSADGAEDMGWGAPPGNQNTGGCLNDTLKNGPTLYNSSTWHHYMKEARKLASKGDWRGIQICVPKR